MIKKLEDFISHQQFYPGIFGLFVNPFYSTRKSLLKHIKSLSSEISGRVLDVGCGVKPYERLFSSKEYVGLEIESTDKIDSKADFVYDGKTFPFKNASFDSVITNQVLEHVFHPEEFLSEIHRVLKKGGKLLLTVPFVWDEHEQPYDFARYSSFGLTSLLKRNGFEVIILKKSVNDIRFFTQLAAAYIYKVLFVKNRIIRLFIISVFISPVILFGEIIYHIFPKNNDLYLDNIVLAEKK